METPPRKLTRDPRPRRNRKERKALVELWQRSSESVETFCARHDITRDSFNRWRAELAADARMSRVVGQPPNKARATPSFVEVRVPGEEDDAQPRNDSADGRVVVTSPSGLRMELHGEPARRAVEQVMTLLLESR